MAPTPLCIGNLSYNYAREGYGGELLCRSGGGALFRFLRRSKVSSVEAFAAYTRKMRAALEAQNAVQLVALLAGHPPGRRSVIDHPDQVDRLLSRMRALFGCNHRCTSGRITDTLIA